ncbi:YgdI/YgdR family lipoprotein [Natronoarchaeum rubrum]|uniref:YgdI/YgdR family lipoprotein n=1 Tax=Natronoarchaeum rubrum TaxID=755311 RepID=UPI002111097F|nr:YgdI/YgdR family lipoprotein [Natronoarchaeum rubrum]
MRRRTFAAALGTSALAGCSSVLTTDDGRDDTPPEDTPNENEKGATGGNENDGPVEFEDERSAASIVDLETIDRTYALSPRRYRTEDGGEIRLRFAETATENHPARIVASLENANDYENTFELRWTPPFGRLGSDHPYPMGGDRGGGEYTYRQTLVLVPTENHDLSDAEPPIERDGDGHWRLAGDRIRLPETVRLDPGEVVRGEYAVVGHADGTGSGRPTGVYEFSRGQRDAVRIAAWNTDEPGPAAASRFEGESVPSTPREDSIAWFHDADASTPTFVRPSTERTDLPAEVEFTFVNRSRESTKCGHWNLYKLVDGRWYHIGPYVHTADCRIVGPGATKTWTLHAFGGESVPCDGATEFGHLGGGRYAAVAGYGHETDHSAAMVKLVGDAVALEPTADATAETSGTTVTVTTARPEEGEHASPATLTATRTDDAESTVITEQLYRQRYRGLRNVLAFFDDGVDRVVVHTDERTAERVVGYDSDVARVGYDGESYEAQVDRRS